MKTKLLLELVECTKVVILNNLLLLTIIYNLLNWSIIYCRFNCGFCSKLIERGIPLKSMTCSFQQFYCHVLEIIKILSLKIFEFCTSIVVLRISIWHFSWAKVKWYLSTHLNAIQIETLVLNQSITHVIILYFLLRIIAPYRQNKRCVVKLTSGNHVWSISTKCVSIETISFRLIITHVTKYWKI